MVLAIWKQFFFLFTILCTHENYGLSDLEAVFCYRGEGILNGNSESLRLLKLLRSGFTFLVLCIHIVFI